jgi:DNA polymerase
MAETTFHSVMENLENYLLYQREQGVRRVEVDRATLRALADSASTASTILSPTSIPEKPEVQARPASFASLEELASFVSHCSLCPLSGGRTQAVPGEGNAEAPDIMFVGEGPGADEDRTGRPFVGKAGQLLTRMIEAMGYRRDEIFIANIVKCRPPKNRPPQPAEMAACIPFLQQQIELIQPKILIALGATALKGLLGKNAGIMRMRGHWQEYNGIRLMPTFHPAFLLRDPAKKKLVWQDLKQVLHALGKEPPKRS